MNHTDSHRGRFSPAWFFGDAAWSAFRRERLTQALQSRLGMSIAIEARHLYMAAYALPPTAADLERICALLQARPVPRLPETGFCVTPRFGTISPWSSKATEIFRQCGLSVVLRVERGLHIAVRTADGEDCSAAVVHGGADLFHDRMTECICADPSDLFRMEEPRPVRVCDVLGQGRSALEHANAEWGLALNRGEVEYLYQACRTLQRNFTDVELVMFGQVNSEHCRHKIFNADWVVDGVPADLSLFGMIRNTHARQPNGTRVAYRDNAAVIEGFTMEHLEACASRGYRYRFQACPLDLVLKVETHNHPTAISPFSGAATGVGGEIRDEAATGMGSGSVAGLCGYAVSNLHVPEYALPWEVKRMSFPARLSTPLQIMLEAPIGGASFGNEFGRPQICGFFRTYESRIGDRELGYHKPIMLAGGMGRIRREQTMKRPIEAGALVVQIGGPALRIGLGGGAASSMAVGSNIEALDFDSVQRGNAEMQRRCQEVIDACVAQGKDNPILAIHDVGAGGLSNACPELVEALGATFDLRAVPNQEPSMSPMEIWCCEAQERYVLVIQSPDRERFLHLCRRERCPAAVIGVVRDDQRLVLEDSHFGNRPIDMPIALLLGNPPREERRISRRTPVSDRARFGDVPFEEAVRRVLQLPAVADKTFLITIADRTVSGLVCRDPMTGPFQTPVADAAVTTLGYTTVHGQAMAMGERMPIAAVNAPASGRMAVAESLMNLAGVAVGDIRHVKLSANWMCACGEPREDAELFETVQSVAMSFCPALGLSIPVGKDSLSMRSRWTASDGSAQVQNAPLSLVISAFAPVADVRLTVTPDLKAGNSVLLLVEPCFARGRLGGGALAQVFNRSGGDVPDVEDPQALSAVFLAVQQLVSRQLLLACHDRSDGGLLVTLAEMAFAGGRGVTVQLPAGDDLLSQWFSEEIGMVLQVRRDHLETVKSVLSQSASAFRTLQIGVVRDDRRFLLRSGSRLCLDAPLAQLRADWSQLTFRMQALRDHPECAREALASVLDDDDPGMTVRLRFDPESPAAPAGPRTVSSPRVAVLREQGINGQREMAAALTLSGFEAVDVHMNDLVAGTVSLGDFTGLVACGGFSYGDVLGAGSGWARAILFNDDLRESFRRFFVRPETFSLGVCNGCQMLSQLRELIPGADGWPRFVRNRSEQFEARLSLVEVLESPSVLLHGMAGSILPVPVAHGEGRVVFGSESDVDQLERQAQVCLRFVDSRGRPAERYPANPNGSDGGRTAFTTTDGRTTIMMPHPERAFRSLQLSYRPPNLFEGEAGPWMRMFRNAHAFAVSGVTQRKPL